MFTAILLNLLLVSLAVAESTTCNLAPSTSATSLCNVMHLPATTQIQLKQTHLFSIDSVTGNLTWTNKYQPIETRWSKVCPSSLCQNNCDQDGFCQVDSSLQLIDNLNKDIQNKFKSKHNVKLFNVTFNLDDENSREIILVKSTRNLDILRSRPNRILTSFTLKSISQTSLLLGTLNCQVATPDMFPIRYDQQTEQLLMRLNSINQQGCYILKLVLQRGDEPAKQEFTVIVNLKDNRLDRPRFDHFIYNFTITENTPLDTIIGKVHATFFTQNSLNSDDDEYDNEFIEYRIVPIISENSFTSQQSDMLPIKIDYLSGTLSFASNIDREKHLNEQNDKGIEQETNQVGLLSLNVESSYAAASYAYSKVNIFIEDINDNAPLARISPLPRFIKRTQQRRVTSLNEISVNEKTAINQILAYVAVFDPDAGENGTIKSIDLTLISFKQPSAKRVKQRMHKINILKGAGFDMEQLKVEDQIKSTKLPFKLNKIGDKMYTIQLVSELSYNMVESYEVEMRIQDNGTQPQLESKTRIHLSVIGQNRHAPFFVNQQSELGLREATFNSAQTIVVEPNTDMHLEWPVVYRFDAIDLDENRNGQVTYKFLNNPYTALVESELEANKLLASTFRLNAGTGELTLLRALKRDDLDGDYLNVTVLASDNAVTNKKSSNFTLRIRVVDLNNNKPEFQEKSANFTIYLGPSIDTTANNLLVSETSNGFKLIGALSITDRDTLASNSQAFNQTKSERFLYKEQTCMRAFHFELVQDNEHFPFKFLIESTGSMREVESVTCRLTIWLDLNDITGINSISKKDFVDFNLEVSDNGLTNLHHQKSSMKVRINVREVFQNLLHIKPENNTSMNVLETLELTASVGTKSIAQFSLGTNSSIAIGTVSKLNNAKPFTTNNLFEIKSSNKLELTDLIEPGAYLIDLELTTILNGQTVTSLEQLQVVLNDQENSIDDLEQLLANYNKQNQRILGNKVYQSDLLHFQGLLLDTNSTPELIKSALFNTQSTINQFILLTCLVALIIASLFTCCICLLIKRKCLSHGRSKKLKNDSKKTLNVSDASSKLDDSQGGFNQIRIDQSSQKSVYDEQKCVFIDPKDKVNRYLEGLSSIGSNDLMINADQLRNISASPPTSLSSLGDSTKKTSQVQQSSIKSGTSLSCISDEGCYGSSDFSTESNNKACQFKQTRPQTYVSPAGTQHYIHNLSRFEKIYNDKQNVDTSDLSRSNLTTPVFQQQQVITAISGSYV